MNDLGHVHGLDSVGGRIFAATHQGVWVLDAAKLNDGFAPDNISRIGNGTQDTMGFTVASSGVMFGPRPNKPVASSGAFHYGTDLAAGCGTPIYAATAGRVVYAGWLGTYGNWVLIDHGSGVMTGYAHIREGGVLVNVGQTVQAGQNVAQVGTTGRSSGCHLHFEVRVGGDRIDPQPFMSARGITLG